VVNANLRRKAATAVGAERAGVLTEAFAGALAAPGLIS
jgi:hypothetical protein